MVQTKRLAALLLTLLALFLVPSAWADQGVQQGTTVSGTVRVYLSSIASNTSVDVSVDGSYSIGGDADREIARGTKLTVSNSGGTLRLAMNGSTQTMGSRFKLRRQFGGIPPKFGPVFMLIDVSHVFLRMFCGHYTT